MGNKITRRRPTIDERYTRPQGLYPQRDVDQRKLRRLILDSKLAPCFPGGEEPAADLEECPICFLHYPSLNRSKCCSKGICTECFLQMKSPHAARPTQCPFCKTPNYAVEYRGPKTLEEKGVEQAEEQKVIEAKIRMRQQELQDDEEREQRREEDIREGRITPETPRAQPNDDHLIEGVPMDERERPNWRSGWDDVDHPSQQGPITSVLFDRPSSGVDPDSLWVHGGYRSDGGLDAAASPQQSMVPYMSNLLPPVSRQRSGVLGFPTPQPPPGAPRPPPVPAPTGFTRHRDDEFDLDLEDIMVMEAIWLSIQEQGARHRFSDAEPTRSAPSRLSGLMTEFGFGPEVDGDLTVLPPPPLPPVPAPEAWDQHPGRRGTVTGGLAGAIAALAERQAVGGDSAAPAQQTIMSILPPDPASGNRAGEAAAHRPSEILNAGAETLESSSTIPQNLLLERCDTPEAVAQRDAGSDSRAAVEEAATGSGREDGAGVSAHASEGLANWVSSTQREYRGASMSKWSGDQSSEQVEVGTSFSSSIPSASELPWEAPETLSDAAASGESSGGGANGGGGGKVMLPESFEEQMMLAMALSIADAQSRVRQGDNGGVRPLASLQRTPQ